MLEHIVCLATSTLFKWLIQKNLSSKLIMFSMFKSFNRQSPQISPSSSRPTSNGPESKISVPITSKRPNIVARKSEADLLRFLRQEQYQVDKGK